MKVCVYAICLNEAAFVERFMASAADADLVVVADTGSTDETVARFTALGAEVHAIRIEPWRFDAARNAALDLVPADVEVCIALDLDQVLRPGWRADLESGWGNGVSNAVYTELWGRTPDGQARAFLNNKVHSRHGWRWVGPAHEYIEPVGDPGRQVMLSGFIVEQFQDQARRRDYVPLMRLALAERPDDPHVLHHLGRELLAGDRPDEAASVLRRYLEIAAPSRGPERNLSLRMLADALSRLGQGNEALALYERAVAEAPDSRGALIDLAFARYNAEAWAPCYEAAAKAADMPRVIAAYGEDSQSGVLPEDMASLCAWRLRKPQEALAFARRAASLAPHVERIARNLERLEAALGDPAGAASGYGQTSTRRL